MVPIKLESNQVESGFNRFFWKESSNAVAQDNLVENAANIWLSKALTEQL